MISETYRGRKIKIVKGREWGTQRVILNGVESGSHIGIDPQKIMTNIQATIDFIDNDPTPDGGRWGAEWYTPGTYELCPEGHPMEIGGTCRHPYCS